MPEQMTTTVDGIDVRVSVAGDGPPVLVLHGAGGSNWRPGYDLLARRFRLYLPEHPGFGTTERPDWLETVQDLAVWYMDVIDRLKLAPVHLVGHSLGGWTAVELASLCSHQLRKLVLVDPAGLRVPGEQRIDLFRQTPEQGARTLYHDQSFADRMLAAQLTPEMAKAQIRNRNMTARLGWNPYLCNPALEPRLRRIPVPTLVVWGKQDKLIPLSHGELYAERIHGATLAVIDECGHLPPVEQPEKFASIVGDFLAE
ncbi:MAG TPA: alpha/beta hydrolase [Chloroflexota bacterium]|jgi:pimeloyl-ACP methyl ester carboxylesterase